MPCLQMSRCQLAAYVLCRNSLHRPGYPLLSMVRAADPVQNFRTSELRCKLGMHAMVLGSSRFTSLYGLTSSGAPKRGGREGSTTPLNSESVAPRLSWLSASA